MHDAVFQFLIFVFLTFATLSSTKFEEVNPANALEDILVCLCCVLQKKLKLVKNIQNMLMLYLHS